MAISESTSVLIANAIAGIFTVAIELARASNMKEEEIDAAYSASREKVLAKDPASHPHPDFDS